MSYYHVSNKELPKGELIHPFGFWDNYKELIVGFHLIAAKGPEAVIGAIMMDRLLSSKYGRKAMAISALIEHVFEDIRKQRYAVKKSRLEAVYLFDDLNNARRFIDHYKPTGIIHACEIECGTVDRFDMALTNQAINLNNDPEQELASLNNRAEKYWLSTEPMEWPEILVWGNVRIISKI